MRTLIEQYIIDRVREKRVEQGMTQEKLAIALGFESQGYISKSESYDDHYNIDHLNEIAKIFKCLPREFWPEEPL
jgi:transcriptional regulator with XRE-family HTH domain